MKIDKVLTINDTLQPDFWLENTLSDEISDKLVEVATNFIDELGINNINHSADWCSARDIIKIMRKIVDTRTNEDFVIGSGKKITVKEILNYGFNCVNLDWEKYVLCNNFSKFI